MKYLYDLLGVGTYGFHARVRPVLLASLPLAAAAWLWAEGAVSGANWLMALAVAGGLPFLLGERAADLGRTRQADLWASWGGPPTLQLVRHRTTTLNPQTLERVHEALANRCAVPLPTATEEATQPAEADQRYQACLDVIRVEAREHPKAYPGVFGANVNYGFRRNYWAIRWWAVAAGLTGIVAAAVHGVFFGVTVGTVVVALIGAGAALWSAFRAGPSFVKPAAFTYALRLLESAESMARAHEEKAS